MAEQTGAYEARVWREGERIRQADGTGYSDRVLDLDIASDAQEWLAEGEYDNAVFAVSVLALRRREAAQKPEEQR